MSNKWKLFRQQYAEPEKSAGRNISDYIEKNLSSYLSEKKTKQTENHPSDLLSKADKQIGKLSRIFEHMDWPMPDYEQVSAQVKQVGLRAYTKSLLDDILPTLLDDKRSKLNQTVINAINVAGRSFAPPINDLYNEYLNLSSEEKIANQFAQAIIIGFTQKILDAEKAKSIKLMEAAIEKLTDKFERDVQNVLLASHLEQKEKDTLSQLRETYQKAIEAQNEANKLRQKNLFEQFNTPMEEIAKDTYVRGIRPTLDIDNMEQAQEFMQAFDQLVEQAEKSNISIPGLENAQKQLMNARDVINGDKSFDNMQEEVKVSLIRKNLVNAANQIINEMDKDLTIKVPSPVENSLWQKFLNFFITTKEMKLYNKQQALLTKLNTDYSVKEGETIAATTSMNLGST